MVELELILEQALTAVGGLLPYPGGIEAHVGTGLAVGIAVPGSRLREAEGPPLTIDLSGPVAGSFGGSLCSRFGKVQSG